MMNKLIIFFLLLISPAFTKEIPKLTKDTVSIAEAGILNKCVHKKDSKKVIYSQFNCPEEYSLIDENWREETNITESSPPKKESLPSFLPFLNGEDVSAYDTDSFTKLPENAPFSDIVNTINEKQKKGEPIDGYDILKEAFKNRNPVELFNEGLRALMYRKQFLDSL